MGPLQGLVLNIALGYVVGAVKDYGASVNWKQLQVQVDTAVQHAIPWHFAEAKVQAVADGVLTAAADVLADEADVKLLLTDLADKDWAGEVSTLKALVAKEWKPEGAEAAAVLALLKAA